MEISQQEETTEAFTTTVEETDAGGVLKLIWVIPYFRWILPLIDQLTSWV